MARHVFTIVTPIANRSALERVLADIQSGLDTNSVVVFRNFPQVHFASFVIFDDKLVFENSVSGSRNAYLLALARYADLDRVYCHCSDYPQRRTTADERYRYLLDHYHRPNLRHVSTPYRTVSSINEDEEMMRQHLEPLALLPPSGLPDPRAQVPAIRESWNWEAVKPYASIAGGLALLSWIAYVSQYVEQPWLRVRNAVLAADIAVPLVFGGLLLLKMWRTTPRAFRVRAFTAMTRAVAVALSLGLAWYAGTAHWIAALVPVAIAAAMSLSLARTVAGWKRGCVAALRQAMSATEAVARWSDLQKQHRRTSPRPYELERASWWEHLWNWRYWIVFPAVTTALVYASRRYQFEGRVYWGLLVAFAIEAWWLTILVGWPPYSIWNRTRGSFLVGAMAVAWLVLESLRIFAPHPFVYAIAVLTTWFALQGVTLSGPDVDVAPPNVNEQKTIVKVMRQEDLGVQNHMALVASVGTSPIRTISLRIFLWSLDSLFYRALLPDVWCGKLFGIPTVHSAQWVLLDDGRFLFLSNYDHSFTTYLNDFGAQIPSGIQKIWGTCAGNPGMSDVERFKLFVRKAMVPHQVWYRAYEDVSVRRIWNNEQIRKNLAFDDGDEMQMLATLRRFGGAPKLVPGITHAAAR